jgi:hypothetical protein
MGKRILHRRIVFAFTASTAIACTSILGVQNLDFVDSGSGGDSAIERSQDERGVDAHEENAPREARVDSRLTFCASQSPAPTFCADFDEDGGMTAWQGGTLTTWQPRSPDIPGVSMFRIDAQPASPPYSLFATVETEAGSYAEVEYDFNQLFSHMTMSFDVRFVEGNSGGVASLNFTSKPTGATCNLIPSVGVAAGALTVQIHLLDGGLVPACKTAPETCFPFADEPQKGDPWSRVILAFDTPIDASTEAATVSLSVIKNIDGGIPIQQFDSAIDTTACAGPGHATIYFGPYNSRNQGVYLDNIVFNAE